MSNAAKKKERQRLKREKKKQEVRRAMSISPYKRIGKLGEVEACYINSNWSEAGLASIHVIRRNPDGGHAMAVFLVDVWCSGLKDAWGRIDLMQEDIKLNLDRARENFELTRIDLETAQRFLASAIRFSRQNGFRLPAHHERWINLIGGVGDVGGADLSGFGKDGKLYWVGTMQNLRARLIGSSVEEFLARPDVDFLSEVTADDEFFEDDDEEDDSQFDELVETCKDAMNSVGNRIAAQVREVYDRRGQQPPETLDSIALYLLAAHIVYDSQMHPEKYEEGVGAAKRYAAMEVIAEKFEDPDTKGQILPPPMDLLKEVGAIVNELGEQASIQASAKAITPPNGVGVSLPASASESGQGPDIATDTTSPPSGAA